jgi:hypothetical protein
MFRNIFFCIFRNSREFFFLVNYTVCYLIFFFYLLEMFLFKKKKFGFLEAIFFSGIKKNIIKKMTHTQHVHISLCEA